MESSRDHLRHLLATLAYRAGKVLRGAPAGFGHFAPPAGVRTPAEILAHMGDLVDWAVTMVEGEVAWHEAKERDWDRLVDRFFVTLQRLDELLQQRQADVPTAQRLFQGPLADALTHTGQLAMLRRMFGEPVKGENYARALIETGRVGRDQAAPVREF